MAKAAKLSCSHLALWHDRPPPQFLKWVGNKQRFASRIVSYAPLSFERYLEPFVGSGAVLATVSPAQGIAGDNHPPLVGLWKLLKSNPDSLLVHYGKLWHAFVQSRLETYERAKASYNADPNPHDLLFLCRSCYGGVVRFRKDGYMSTPIGPHRPISPESLGERMTAWRERLKNTEFMLAHFAEILEMARPNDLIYCDPPYTYSQAILYGSQAFKIADLWHGIEKCCKVGAKVMLSLDGKKKSGSFVAHFSIPEGLFKREVMIECGRSMLRRFQRAGETLEDEVVHDRLLLTW